MEKITIQVTHEQLRIIKDAVEMLNKELGQRDLRYGNHPDNVWRPMLILSDRLKSKLNDLWNNRGFYKGVDNPPNDLLPPRQKQFNVARVKEMIKDQIARCDKGLNSSPSNDLGKLFSGKKLGLKVALAAIEAEEGLLNRKGEVLRSVIMQGAPR